VAGRAYARIVNFFHTQRATLPDNFRGEIDFVMRWANTGAELHDHARGIGAEAINRFPDRIRDDAELGAFASGVYKTDRRRFWIDNVNSTTVGNVNAQRDAALIRDDAVAPREFYLASLRYLVLRRNFRVATRVLGRLSFYEGEG